MAGLWVARLEQPRRLFYWVMLLVGWASGLSLGAGQPGWLSHRMYLTYGLALGVDFFHQQVAQFVGDIVGGVTRQGSANQAFCLAELVAL